MLEVLRHVVGVRHLASKPFEKTLFTDRHVEYVILDPSLYACDGLSPLPVTEKTFSGLSETSPKPPRASEALESPETYSNRIVFL